MYVTTVQNADSTDFVKDGYRMVVPDDRHLRRYVKILQNEDYVRWTLALLCIHYALCFYCNGIFPAQGIKLSNIRNNFTAIVRHNATFANTMQSLLSYARAFEADYSDYFVNVRILNIVEM